MNESSSKQRRSRRNRWRKNKPTPEMIYVDNHQITYPVRGYYKILVGNYGVKPLCKMVCDDYNYVSFDSDDSDSPYPFRGPSVDQLTKLMLILHIVRCFKVSIQLGYYHNYDEKMDALQKHLRYQLLPSILCEYIEAIGSFQLKNGITVVPWFAPMEEFYASDLEQLIPDGFMEEAELESCVPKVRFDLRLVHNSRSNCPSWLQLRRIDWECTYGSCEMVISTKLANGDRCSNDRVICISPQECSEAEAERGALYNFRRFSEQSAWPVETAKVCQDFFRTEAIYVYAGILDKINSTNDTSETITIGPTLYEDYRILTGNYGIENLCRLVHNMIKSGSAVIQSTRQPSFNQLVYIMIICHIVRCYRSDCDYDKEIIRLKECLVINIQLPSILCKYIEAIGKFQLKNGITVVPWFGRKAEFYSSDLGQLTPEMVLRRAGRSIPENDNWCIDYDWIYDFRGKVQFLISSMPWLKLRRIHWDDEMGSIEMLITTRTKHNSEDTPVPTCPEECSVLEAQRGALFNYRQFSERSVWPGETSVICEDFFSATGSFIPATVLKSYSAN